jgi:GNAT superfamily N-acetyltransferase
VRALQPGEVALVETAFVLTADWNPAATKGEAFWRADPTFAQYTGEWGRPGDSGFVAEEDDRVVGAVWWRLFTAENPGYGFVDERTPELGIAVWPGERGRGIGRLLLRAATAEHPRLSLSVEDGNRARALYESEGFVAVGRSGDGTIMLRSS